MSYSFSTTWPEAANHAIAEYCTLPHGPGITGALPKISVVPPPSLWNFFGAVRLNSGINLILHGMRQAAGVLLPTGGAAATQFAHRAYSPLELSRIVRAQTDPETQQLIPGPSADTAIWLLFENSPAERAKFMEWFMIAHYITWATAGAVLCAPTICGSPFDLYERRNGVWTMSEIKTFTYHYEWSWSPETRTWYLYIRASIKFGSSPVRPLVRAGGGSLHMIYLILMCRWRRRVRIWRGRASSLGIDVPNGSTHKGVDPKKLWIPTSKGGAFPWLMTVGASNIGQYQNATQTPAVPGPQQPTRHPIPPTPRYLSREHELMAEAWTELILSGRKGPYGARIEVAPFVELPTIKFS